jgi:UDP-glucose 4-epimerase
MGRNQQIDSFSIFGRPLACGSGWQKDVIGLDILVTGGAGFIGHHAVHSLLKHHHHVTIVDDLSHGSTDYLPVEADFYQMDILSVEFQRFMAAHHFDAVIHLAAQVRVDVSEENPAADARLNIEGTLAVLKGAAAAGAGRFVFASSAAVYGNPLESDMPLKESHPLQPLSPYGLSKAAAEAYVAMIASRGGLDYVILRFANVYGERLALGNPGGVIQIFAQCLATHEPVTFLGREKRTRDWIYAGDIAEAISSALVTTQANRVYNISTGVEVSLQDVLYKMELIAGYHAKQVTLPPREGDIARSVLDNTEAKTLLDWHPAVSLEEGLSRTIDFACCQIPHR